jgi:hypothetical protein
MGDTWWGEETSTKTGEIYQGVTVPLSVNQMGWYIVHYAVVAMLVKSALNSQ